MDGAAVTIRTILLQSRAAGKRRTGQRKYLIPPSFNGYGLKFRLIRQRAFRQRKEQHVKELEEKLSAFESSVTNLASDNQRLKLALQRAMTENDILRATSGVSRYGPSTASASMPMVTSPSPSRDDSDERSDDQYSSRGPSPHHEEFGTKKPSSGVLMSSTAVWDYLVEHPLVRAGRVDITDTVNRLRRAAKPGNHGPMFPENEVKRAVETSRRAGGDALI